MPRSALGVGGGVGLPIFSYLVLMLSLSLRLTSTSQSACRSGTTLTFLAHPLTLRRGAHTHTHANTKRQAFCWSSYLKQCVTQGSIRISLYIYVCFFSCMLEGVDYNISVEMERKISTTIPRNDTGTHTRTKQKRKHSPFHICSPIHTSQQHHRHTNQSRMEEAEVSHRRHPVKPSNPAEHQRDQQSVKKEPKQAKQKRERHPLITSHMPVESHASPRS